MEKIINDAWENRSNVSIDSDKSILDAISNTIDKVDKGEIRIAEKKESSWRVGASIASYFWGVVTKCFRKLAKFRY